MSTKVCFVSRKFELKALSRQVIKICPDVNLLESLQECQSLLEVVQKGLSNYLEMKRRIFPRFYFLSDEELLEILAQAKNVQAVQPHLRKCFENIQEVRFEEDLQITRMYSAEREEVVLDPPMYPLRSVEFWLGDLETVMRTTIRNIIGTALLVIDVIPRKAWVYMWPGQVTLCCGQTYWTAQVENGIRTKTLSDYYQRLLAHVRHRVAENESIINKYLATFPSVIRYDDASFVLSLARS